MVNGIADKPRLPHRIRRAVFKLRFSDERSALGARRQMEELVQQAILPLVEEAFDAYAPNGRVLSFDRLEIDLGRLDPGQPDLDQLRQAVLAQLSRQLEESVAWPGAAQALLSPPVSAGETLLAFLETGRWPWHAVFKRAGELEAAVQALEPDRAEYLARRIGALLGKPAVRQRLAYQFSLSFVHWLIAALHPGRAAEILHLAQEVGVGLDPGQVAVLALAVGPAFELNATGVMVRRMEDERERLRIAGDRAAELAAPAVRVDAAGMGRQQGGDDGAGGLYVRHAGIVLLHPFLERFFERVRGLGASPEGRTDLRGRGEGDPQGTLLASLVERERGVHLLHFLATGREQPDEHETTLLKLLCGLPLAYPVVKDLALLQAERNEAEALLLAAIGHWEKLKHTSPAGLRETFLERDGKLAPAERGWRLVVEQRPPDVLLGYLPWGLSIVRLPWMAGSLGVDWA